MMTKLKPTKNRKSEKNRFSYFSKLKHHQNRQGKEVEDADFNTDKIKTDKKPEVREKPVFHTF